MLHSIWLTFSPSPFNVAQHLAFFYHFHNSFILLQSPLICLHSISVKLVLICILFLSRVSISILFHLAFEMSFFLFQLKSPLFFLQAKIFLNLVSISNFFLCCVSISILFRFGISFLLFPFQISAYLISM